MVGRQKGTILIVEDKAQFRRIYNGLLSNDGYTVIEAEDGEMGWRRVKEDKPDLVLLDLVLPKLHGFEVLERIRADEETKQIPVIIFSMLGNQEDIQKGFELGANDYALKGSQSPRDVIRKIQGLLARTQAVGAPAGSPTTTSPAASPTSTPVSTPVIPGAKYQILVMLGKRDAVALVQDIGLSKVYECPDCGGSIVLELVPDATRTEGHWFLSHFVCEQCGRGL
jgi:DNA-binding response OmpR family regulator